MAIVPRKARALQSGAADGAARDDARLVTDYQTAICNLAQRLGRDRADARDISQEVFLKAYRAGVRRPRPPQQCSRAGGRSRAAPASTARIPGSDPQRKGQ